MKNRDMPAKPCQYDTGQVKQVEMNQYRSVLENGPGLTKLETAAIAAMQGFLADPEITRDGNSLELIIKSSVKAANALFDELEKGNE